MIGLHSLSCVIITRNEEDNIARVIQSALGALESAERAGLVVRGEVILADSASSDRTVEIARGFPIKVVQLPPHWPLSASAGRYVGTTHVSSDFILYLDGDYVVRKEWVSEALALLVQENVAGVTGTDIERFPGNTILEERLSRWARELGPSGEVEEVEAIAVGILKRSTVLEVGGFHPFLKGAEDRDLGYRLRMQGYRLLRTRQPMGEHHWADSGAGFNYITYYRSVAFWSFGEGQACRVRFDNAPIRRKIVGRYGTSRHLMNFGVASLLLVLGILNATAVLAPSTFVLPAFVADVAAVYAVSRFRQSHHLTVREVLFELAAIPYSVIRFAAFALGFMAGAPPPSQYPRGPTNVSTTEKSAVSAAGITQK